MKKLILTCAIVLVALFSTLDVKASVNENLNIDETAISKHLASEFSGIESVTATDFTSLNVEVPEANAVATDVIVIIIDDGETIIIIVIVVE